MEDQRLLNAASRVAKKLTEIPYLHYSMYLVDVWFVCDQSIELKQSFDVSNHSEILSALIRRETLCGCSD